MIINLGIIRFNIYFNKIESNINLIRKILFWYSEYKEEKSYKCGYFYTDSGYVSFCVLVKNVDYSFEKRVYKKLKIKFKTGIVSYKKIKKTIIPILDKKFNLGIDLKINYVYYTNFDIIDDIKRELKNGN